MEILGIDVGGSSIKGAVVEVVSGELLSETRHIETPQPATPVAVVNTICELTKSFAWHGAVGCGFPAVVQNGIVKTAANIDADWLGVNLSQLLQGEMSLSCTVINDADAAGIAEMQFGAGVGRMGTVLVLTLGTGIGSALFCRGELMPNLELGSMAFRGAPVEHYASAAVRKNENLSWQVWAGRLNEFLSRVERLFSPELIIIGGGVSTQHENFFPHLTAQAELVPAQFYNRAGIVGAAMFAAGRDHN